MVMAGNENGAGPIGPEEPLASRLQWLRQRRQALQDKLLLKNTELKNLCIDEAELTGILPAETPLEPGESPPSFGRRVGTTFTYPANLINKPKTAEAEECALESERQIQIGVAEAAFAKFNDPAEGKAVRRKYRLVYQQSQKRLQELDTRLSFVRHGHGKSRRNAQPAYPGQPSGKHRSKKPRPPLEAAGSERGSKSSRGLLQEGGVSLSPLGQQEHSYDTYPGTGYQDAEMAAVQPAFVYPQNRPAHGIVQRSSPTPRRRQSPKLMVGNDVNDNHNVYILPDQYRARTYSHGSGGSRNANHCLDTERSYRPVPNTYSEQERILRYRPMQHPAEYNAQCYPEYQPNLPHPRREPGRSGGPPTDPHQPPGYWFKYENEIIWCPDDQTLDKFGSLDRRKRNTVHNAPAQDSQIRYHTVAGSKSTSILPRHNVPLNPPQEQNTGGQTSSRMLLRTQSLGSVETRTSESVADDSGKGKEKGWYETSVDSGPPGMPRKGRTSAAAQTSQTVDDRQKRRYHQPPKILEIPAESTVESPCTIVQAGKYQPYREVTKPFEMSDFYKYSTKYRKRNENAAQSQPHSPVMTNLNSRSVGISSSKLPQDPRVNMMMQMSKDLRIDNGDQTSAPSPVQKRIYQPLQRMTCQPYNALR